MGKNNSLAQFIPLDKMISERIQQGKKEIAKNKKKVLNIAEVYNNKYEKEILEGDNKVRKMLREDSSLKEEDVHIQFGKFVPSLRTPILNFLYFFVNEGYDDEKELEREIQDEKYGRLFEEVDYTNVVEPKDMEQLVYGNCTHKTFKTIKKLKNLSKSIANEHEAAAAYIACMKMCKKHNLDYEKIPI